MTTIIKTCLLGVGLFAAAATLPSTLAHEGHDHGAAELPPQVSPSKAPSSVVTTPPPFDTLGSKSALPSDDRGRSNERAQPPTRQLSPREKSTIPRFEFDGLPTAPPTFNQYSRETDRTDSPRFEGRGPDDAYFGRREFSCPLESGNAGSNLGCRNGPNSLDFGRAKDGYPYEAQPYNSTAWCPLGSEQHSGPYSEPRQLDHAGYYERAGYPFHFPSGHYHCPTTSEFGHF